jgi:hypothetical protein
VYARLEVRCGHPERSLRRIVVKNLNQLTNR